MYVNDILIEKDNKPDVQKVNFMLNNDFHVKDLGVRNILVIKIIRRCDLKHLHVSYETYLK